MKIGICISTYQRPDGKTPFYLNRALKSIEMQNHQDYKIYVIGDAYENEQELTNICSIQNKCDYYNLKESIERNKYPFGDYRLFCAGGVTPGLIGIDYALKDGIEYICHLDHDDYWESNHLELINNVIEEKQLLFICTLSSYWGSLLPQIDQLNDIREYLPHPGGCCLSSSCIKYSDINVRFRDYFTETGEAFPSDADFWIRLAGFMKENNKRGYIITTLTCHHDEEGYSFRGDFK